MLETSERLTCKMMWFLRLVTKSVGQGNVNINGPSTVCKLLLETVPRSLKGSWDRPRCCLFYVLKVCDVRIRNMFYLSKVSAIVTDGVA